MVLIKHPGTGGEVDVPEQSLVHYRAGGWMTAAELDEWETATAERAAKADAGAAKASAAEAKDAAKVAAKGANVSGQEK